MAAIDRFYADIRLRCGRAWPLALLVGWSRLACDNLNHRHQSLDAVLPPNKRIHSGKYKTALPVYVVAPPDIVLSDAVKVVPKPPYRLEAPDIVQIKGQKLYPDHPFVRAGAGLRRDPPGHQRHPQAQPVV